MFKFEIMTQSNELQARAGRIRTAHGDIQTPVFMPVGTLGTVKSLSPEELLECGSQIILGNTYHLYLRPGCDVISRFSGLHRFMSWDKPILTDSGGFQIFSLAKLTQLSAQGATFQSHLDGSTHLLTPEKAIEIQTCLGSDILMCLDVCISYPASLAETRDALKKTSLWAGRCKKAWERSSDGKRALFGIVQGGMYKDLREESAAQLEELDFGGYAVGGLSVGEPKDTMLDMAEFTLPKLPHVKPKYVMGVGSPEELVELVALGADMFDCVLPTRNSRNGQLCTQTGTINIRNSRFKQDTKEIDPGCTCYTCQNFSRAYLRHLFMSKELLAYRLNTIHNIHYYTQLMARMRQAIADDRFGSFRKEFYSFRCIK